MSHDVVFGLATMPDEDVAAVVACLESGWLTMGPRTQEFEAAIAAYAGTEYAVTVSSGTAALHLACLAVGVAPDNAVLVPALGCPGGAAAAEACGAEPALCDVAGSRNLNLDPADVERRLTARARAVIATHLHGYTADVAALRSLCDEGGIALIEDCGHALGARTANGALAGTEGHVGCLSFAACAQLPVGEGGAIVTDDAELAARVRSLRSHAMTSGTWDRHRGHAASYDVVDIGFNYRLDEPRAALGLSRLPRVDGDIAQRRDVVRACRRELGSLPGLELPWDEDDVARSSHFALPVLLEDRERRDAFRAGLDRSGVETRTCPAGPRPALAAEVAERLCVLPVSPAFGEEEIAQVAKAGAEALGARPPR